MVGFRGARPFSPSGPAPTAPPRKLRGGLLSAPARAERERIVGCGSGTCTLAIERKFDAGIGHSFRLAGLPGVDQVEGLWSTRLEAEYFDTRTCAWRTARITLRRRTGGEDAGWRLKLPSGRTSGRNSTNRSEKTKMGSRTAREAGARAHQRSGLWIRLPRLKTRRVVHRLLNRRRAVLASVSDDRVHAETLRAERAIQRWREWESNSSTAPGPA